MVILWMLFRPIVLGITPFFLAVTGLFFYTIAPGMLLAVKELLSAHNLSTIEALLTANEAATNLAWPVIDMNASSLTPEAPTRRGTFSSILVAWAATLLITALCVWCDVGVWLLDALSTAAASCYSSEHHKDENKVGVFWNPSGTAGARMDSILKHASFPKYTSPAWCVNGDWCTLVANVVGHSNEVPLRRLFLPVGGPGGTEYERYVSLDVFMVAERPEEPSEGGGAGEKGGPRSGGEGGDGTGGREREREGEEQTAVMKPVYLVLPGMGSDSSMRAVRELAARVRRNGSLCIVLNPMGLKSDLQEHVTSVGGHMDLDVMHSAICAVCSAAAPAPVMLVGFSMGGILITNYLGNRTAPANVVGCMCVSGALKIDFIASPHYSTFYQPLIVADIIDDILGKYGRDIHQSLGAAGLQSLASARTYADLHERFFAQLPFPSALRDWQSWKAGLEGWDTRGSVHVPTLIMTALDDPFHGIDELGFEEQPVNPNIAYFVTSSGGHLGWPQGLLANADGGYMTNAILRFTESCCYHSSPSTPTCTTTDDLCGTILSGDRDQGYPAESRKRNCVFTIGCYMALLAVIVLGLAAPLLFAPHSSRTPAKTTHTPTTVHTDGTRRAPLAMSLEALSLAFHRKSPSQKASSEASNPSYFPAKTKVPFILAPSASPSLSLLARHLSDRLPHVDAEGSRAPLFLVDVCLSV